MARRRSPPSALRLLPFTAPLPPRGSPKHVLPSVPQPSFHTGSGIVRGPSPKPRAPIREPWPASRARQEGQCDTGYILSTVAERLAAYDFIAGASSASSTPSSSPGHSRASSACGSFSMKRGPWDHAGCIPFEFDVAALLAPPLPAAVSPFNR